MEFEIRMNEQSLYTLYRNGFPIATFNSALEHTSAREIENRLNGVHLVDGFDIIRSSLKAIENKYKIA